MRAGRAPPRISGGLTLRVATASALLSLLIGGVFAILIGAIVGMRNAAVLARRTERVIAAADNLERLVIDIETGQRGYLLTRDEQFLKPWEIARANFGPRAAGLRMLAVAHEQKERVNRIALDGAAYIRDYSNPAVEAAKRTPGTGKSEAVSVEGKQQVDRIRREFQVFIGHEQDLSAKRSARSQTATRRVVIVAVSGLGTSVLLIVAYSVYFTRSVIRPVRCTSRMAGEVARGNLSVRVPEAGKAEIGNLERSFNAMVGSLGHNRDALIASRARIIAAGDEARRRIERDLHDGTQQRLVTLSLKLGMAMADVPHREPALKRRLADAVHEMTNIALELREISQGIQPAIFNKCGLGPALSMLTRRSAVPIDLRMDSNYRLDERIEIAVYYIASEALTNTTKHAHAACIHIDLTTTDSGVQLLIRDDGVGGADLDHGSGLIGLQDRVEALGGDIKIVSPRGIGTTLLVRLPAEPVEPE